MYMHNKLNHIHLLQKIIHLQKGDTKRRKNTTDDRWVALYNYILEQMNTYGKPREDIIITTTLYRQLTNCTDYAARKELAQFCQEGSLHRIPTAKTLIIYVGDIIFNIIITILIGHTKL